MPVSEPPKEASQILLDVADAAVIWWVTRVPFTWSLETHLTRPHFGCHSPEELVLADKVAAWCQIQQGQPSGRAK